MELNDALRRIVGLHWRLIVACFALGVAGAVAVDVRAAPVYTASARLVLDVQDPKSGAESTAIADTAKAIATSPAVVAAALHKVTRPERDPAEVARRISVRALGTSGVVELSVGDRSARGAAAITNALADELIATRGRTNGRNYDRTLAALRGRIRVLTTEAARLDGKIAQLDARAQAPPQRAGVVSATREDLMRARELVDEDRSSLESRRDALLTAHALRATPSIISKATAPPDVDPANVLSNVILGGFAGLILGIGGAGLLETVRPTTAGGNAIARRLDTVHLGTLPFRPDLEQPSDRLAQITARLRLVATALERPRVELVTADGLPVTALLAQQLDALAAGAVAEPAARAGDGQAVGGAAGATRAASRTVELSSFGVRSFGFHQLSLDDPAHTGLVPVLPTTLEQRRLDDLAELAESASLRILGVVTYVPSRRRHVGENVTSESRWTMRTLLGLREGRV